MYKGFQLWENPVLTPVYIRPDRVVTGMGHFYMIHQ